ncbi:hypothetical protein NDU88_001438 [Pleurodeles waltl]|uniref:Uncharacterized protein n=1 Tax=Pleurodeles waltl TaxID=8319 RepID=A0AAV7LLH5_PLEWA|nr:hypothetical protein NDU88_001438 [Pleurodeles waltl]
MWAFVLNIFGDERRTFEETEVRCHLQTQPGVQGCSRWCNRRAQLYCSEAYRGTAEETCPALYLRFCCWVRDRTALGPVLIIGGALCTHFQRSLVEVFPNKGMHVKSRTECYCDVAEELLSRHHELHDFM